MSRISLTFLAICVCSLLPARQIAVLERTYLDPGRENRPIPTLIYYPGETSAAHHRQPYPLMVFGHGWLMRPSHYRPLSKMLVEAGWIVAFPATESQLYPSHHDFALDLEFVLRSVLEENTRDGSELRGLIAPHSVLAGHSMGGGAAVLAARNTVASALLTFAAAETNPSASAAARQVRIPTLFIFGDRDQVTPFEQHQLPIYQNLASDRKSYVCSVGSGHFTLLRDRQLLNWLDSLLGLAGTIPSSQTLHNHLHIQEQL